MQCVLVRTEMVNEADVLQFFGSE